MISVMGLVLVALVLGGVLIAGIGVVVLLLVRKRRPPAGFEVGPPVAAREESTT